MIIFHEGLPGSGKSYEAMAARIVPSIQAGREVVAYVEGIDHEKIAELTGITVERCRELLHTVTREQMRGDWVALCRDNAMHVFDEAQNFWGNRVKLIEAQTQLITEHRHRGMDLVLMGQDLRDVHATWRRRVELKLCFLKLNAFGKGKRYSVTTYRHLGGDEFAKAGTTITKYDPKFFGTYKSHVTDETNTEVYTDSRAQVWNHPMLRYVVPIAIAAACFGMWKAWAFFHPAAPIETKAEKANPAPAHPPASRPVASASAVYNAPPAQDKRTAIERRMSELSAKGRIRLAGLISSAAETNGVIEWVQGGTVVIERLSLNALRSLGVAVMVSDGNLVQIAIGDFQELATPWPLDENMGRMSESRQAAIKGPAPVTASATESTTYITPKPKENQERPGTLQSIVREAQKPR